MTESRQERAMERCANLIVKRAGRFRLWEAKLLSDRELRSAVFDYINERWRTTSLAESWVPDELMNEARRNLNNIAKGWLQMNAPWRLQMAEDHAAR